MNSDNKMLKGNQNCVEGNNISLNFVYDEKGISN